MPITRNKKGTRGKGDKGGGGRVNNYRDNKNCTWFAIIISRALESNKICSLRVVPCGRERERGREREWRVERVQTPREDLATQWGTHA